MASKNIVNIISKICISKCSNIATCKHACTRPKMDIQNNKDTKLFYHNIYEIKTPIPICHVGNCCRKDCYNNKDK